MRMMPRSIVSVIGVILAFSASVATPAGAATFSFTTGTPDGKLGALSRRASPGKLETETADDFILQETTVINRASIIGLVPLGTPVGNIKEVEIEMYHVFPLDSVQPPSGNVPSRNNSPSDVEIDSATRARSSGTLKFSVDLRNAGLFVANTVVNGINKLPNNVRTMGEGPVTGGKTIGLVNVIVISISSPVTGPS